MIMYYKYYAFILITIFVFIAICRKSSLFSPVSVNCISWYLTFIPGMMFFGDYYPITDNVFIAWVIWFFTLNIIFLVFEPKSIKQFKINSNSGREIKFNYQYIIYFLSLILLYRIWVVGSSGQEHFFLNLRLGSNGIDGFESIGYIGLFYPLILSLFVFENIFRSNSRNQKIMSLSIWLALFAVATMGKFAVLTPILIWVAINFLKGRVKLLKLILVAFFSMVLMLLTHYIRAGENSTFDFFKLISIYTYSPFVGLGYIDFTLSNDFGATSLRFFYAVIHFLWGGNEPINLIYPYVNVPIPTNIYTVLFPFLYDFGFFGVFVFSLIYGVFFGFLYRWGALGNNFYISLYMIYMPYLFTQFLGEGLFSVLSSNIQMAFCMCIVFFISKKVKYG